MALPLKSLLRYWRAALLDSNRRIDPNSLSLHSCPRDQLATGRIEGEGLAEVWRDAEDGLSRRQREELRLIPILIATQVLEPESEHSAAYSTMRRTRVPMWLCARVDREGRLYPAGAPVVDRAVLAPLTSGAQTFASVEAVDKYLNDNPAPGEDADWATFWDHVMGMFAGLFGGSPDDWVPDRHVDRGAFVAHGSRPIDASRAIREIYEVLIDAKDGSPPTLLARLADPSPSHEITTTQDGNSALARRHLGQMGGEFSLNPSQRQSLGAILATGDGEIIAVNGPPGTGKTTFIQSVVASLWVESALTKGGEPPVILASSTNNKAITNILDSFARATLPAKHPLAGSPLLRRWLPDLNQYGLYLPSRREVEKGVKEEHTAAWCFQGGQPWSGLPGMMETQDYVTRAEALWRTQFAAWADQAPTNMTDAVEVLQSALIARTEALTAAGHRHVALLAALPAGSLPSRSEMDALRAEIVDLRHRLDEFRRHGHRAVQLIEGSFIESMLLWLPPVRQRLWRRTHSFLDTIGLADPAWSWDTILDATAFRRWLTDNVRASETIIVAKAKIVTAWDNWIAALTPLLPNLSPDEVMAAPEQVESALDTVVRPELFHLAGRYWEGRWLIEMTQALERNDKTFTGRSREMCESRWRRFAKLTPCLVSTAFTAPRLFDYYNGDTERLFGFIDLLIIDEAGQVPPQVGATLFAFARKALVIGDVFQLEPVWGIDANTDGGNLMLYGMDGDRAVLERNGMRASEGSVMALAQSSTAFAAAPHRGLFLDEHWRCRASIIAYCNELAYRGALKPMRPDGDYPLPALGYAHVPGRARRTGLSWSNADEATVIAHWLRRRREELTNYHCVDKLGKIVAIVTPFRAQIGVLRKALSTAGLDGDDIIVGTVHTLQGAEKDVVLFSPVYGADHDGRLFFDGGVSMLNVAVSRARQSFLIFGNLRLFRPDQPSLPSGLLALYLFKSPENEITDIDPINGVVLEAASELERLNDLNSHCSVLRQAIVEANERLLIVSPYLSHEAVEADNLVPLLRSRKGSAKIVVAYDRHLNADRDRRPLQRAIMAMEALTAAGVELWALDGAHNKTLAVDESWIVEGSFNWLSATRNRDSRYQRHEVSLLYRGKDASRHVNNAWQEAASLRKQS
jgi:hypothetical protein